MEVFYGKNNNNVDVAVKIEIKNKKTSDASNEAIILSELEGIEQIPNFYYLEVQGEKKIVVESLFGPSLKSFFINNDSIFEPILVSIIGIQIINILMQIHNKAVIHNDIKPHNICWGKFDNSLFTEADKFFLVDFGYSRKIGEIIEVEDNKGQKNKNKLIHYNDSFENKFAGTGEYMAIRISEGYRPSRRTDMEELIYTLLKLIKKKLPWTEIKGKNHMDICRKMGQMKKNVKLDELFLDVPQEIYYIYKNILK